MKTSAQVVTSIENRLTKHWATDLLNELTGAADTSDTAQPAAGAGAWPHQFPLGTLTGDLSGSFSAYLEDAATWRTWARDRPVSLRTTTRHVSGTPQQVITHLVVSDLDAAAAVCGGSWPTWVRNGRHRVAVLHERFPAALPSLRARVGELARLSDVDFELLSTAAAWFAENDAAGLTPRQVPVPGLHAKWLNSRQHLVAELAGLTSLALAPAHPPRIHFTYLDPEHLAAGGRRHDSATVGDQMMPAYAPRVVVISENKDTAIHFPPMPGAIAIEGGGAGGRTAAGFSWLVDAPVLLYWGDLDAHGFEILDGYRRAGVPARSILMDATTYRTYARFGTDFDVDGKPLKARPARDTPTLEPAERALYERLVGEAPGGPRRLEQERLPLHLAQAWALAAASAVRAPALDSRGPQTPARTQVSGRPCRERR